MLSRQIAYLMPAPAVLLIGCVFLVPFVLLLLMGFWSQPPGSLLVDTSFTLENYVRIFSDDFYLRGLWTTIWLSFLATAVCLVLGLPVAYFLSSSAPAAFAGC